VLWRRREWAGLNAALQLSASESGIITVEDGNDNGGHDGDLDYSAFYRYRRQWIRGLF
jgi:hypothetical protein